MAEQHEAVGRHVVDLVAQRVGGGGDRRIENEDPASQPPRVEEVAEEVADEAQGRDDGGHDRGQDYPTGVADLPTT